MRKKIPGNCITVIFLVFLISFSAFAAELETAGPGITEMFSDYGYALFDEVRSLSDSELDEFIVQLEEEDKQSEKEGVKKYKAIKSKLGGFEGYKEATVYQTEKKNFIISVIGGFENGECVMTMTLMGDLKTISAVDFQFIAKNKGNIVTPIIAGLLAAVCAAAIMLLVRGIRKKGESEDADSKEPDNKAADSKAAGSKEEPGAPADLV